MGPFFHVPTCVGDDHRGLRQLSLVWKCWSLLIPLTTRNSRSRLRAQRLSSQAATKKGITLSGRAASIDAQKAKQTLAEMRAIGAALDKYAADHGRPLVPNVRCSRNHS